MNIASTSNTTTQTKTKTPTDLLGWLNSSNLKPEKLKFVTMKNFEASSTSKSTKQPSTSTKQSNSTSSTSPKRYNPIFNVDVDVLNGHTFVKLNYSQINCPKSFKLSWQARGIILKYQTNDNTEPSYEIVCYPFNRFFNFGQTQAAEIDWESVTIREKVDGSIVMLWWCQKNMESPGHWQWSSRGKIKPFEPMKSGSHRLAKKLGINYDSLNKGYTYMFELCTYKNVICLIYPEERLVHLGTRCNKTYVEYKPSIGLPTPTVYTFQTLQKVLDDNTLNIEGYVLVDKNWNRVKIKTESYLKIHQNNSGTNWLIKYLAGDLDNLLGDLNSPGLQKIRDDYHTLYTVYYEKTKKLLAVDDKKTAIRSKTFPKFLK